MSSRRKDRGAAAVEMAIMASLLVLVAMGIIDLGRVVYAFVGIQDAAQEGAVYGSFNPGDDLGAEDRAREATDYPDLATGGSVDVRFINGGCTVESEVSYDLDLVTPVMSQMLGSPFTISRTFSGEVFDGDNCAGP